MYRDIRKYEESFLPLESETQLPYRKSYKERGGKFMDFTYLFSSFLQYRKKRNIKSRKKYFYI